MAKPFAWVIEDDVVLGEIFSTALKLAGFEAGIIADSRQAMTKLLERKPVLVTLDMQMPFVSGMDILRKIRAQEQLKDIKVIIVTASAQALQDADIEAMADIVVMKPIALHQLVDLAGRLIKFDESGLLLVDEDDEMLEETAIMPMPVRIDADIDAAETRVVTIEPVNVSETADAATIAPPGAGDNVLLTTTSEHSAVSSTGELVELILLDEDEDDETLPEETAVIPMPVRLDADEQYSTSTLTPAPSESAQDNGKDQNPNGGGGSGVPNNASHS